MRLLKLFSNTVGCAFTCIFYAKCDIFVYATNCNLIHFHSLRSKRFRLNWLKQTFVLQQRQQKLWNHHELSSTKTEKKQKINVELRQSKKKNVSLRACIPLRCKRSRAKITSNLFCCSVTLSILFYFWSLKLLLLNPLKEKAIFT